MGQHDPSLATKNNKILISACNRGKGEQREWNSTGRRTSFKPGPRVRRRNASNLRNAVVTEN